MKNVKLIIASVLAIGFILLVFIYGGRRLGRDYLDFHATVKTRIENIFDTLPFDRHIRQAHFDYLRATHRGHYNGVTFLNDGRLMLDTLEYSLFLHERTTGIAFLDEFAEENGASFLYVRIPNKLENNSFLPIAFSDNDIIEGSNRLMNHIRDFGIDVLDLRVEMERDGVDFTTAFYKGDHHWKTGTILWAFGKIAEFVNSEYNFNIGEMMWDPLQFEHITYENSFSGEESRAVNAVLNYEDITVMVPKFNTEFVITDLTGTNYMGRLDSGNFADVFVPWVNNEYNESLVFGDLNRWFDGFTRYENAAASEDKNVLLVMDSMGIPLATFFANAFTRVDNLYLQNGFNHRIWYAIENYGYDLIIFAVSDVVVADEDTADYRLDRLFLGDFPW
jgi:hypothetical protein